MRVRGRWGHWVFSSPFLILITDCKFENISSWVEIFQVNVLDGEGESERTLRRKSTSSLNECSRALREASLSMMGAARTVTCVRKETASNRLMINICIIWMGSGLKTSLTILLNSMPFYTWGAMIMRPYVASSFKTTNLHAHVSHLSAPGLPAACIAMWQPQELLSTWRQGYLLRCHSNWPLLV